MCIQVNTSHMQGHHRWFSSYNIDISKHSFLRILVLLCQGALRILVLLFCVKVLFEFLCYCFVSRCSSNSCVIVLCQGALQILVLLCQGAESGPGILLSATTPSIVVSNSNFVMGYSVRANFILTTQLA